MLPGSRSEALLRHCGQQARRKGKRCVSSQRARDVREISDSSQSPGHHGWARNTFSFLVPGSELRPLLPCCRAHPGEASPSNFLSFYSYYSLSLRGKGVFGGHDRAVIMSCPISWR